MRSLLIIVFISFLGLLRAQDTIQKTSDTTKVHQPKRALLFSAIIPGSGQIYNHIAMPKGKKKAFWKVPLIYAGLGTMGYFLIHNQRQQIALKDEYNSRIAGNASAAEWAQYDNTGLLTLYNQHLDRRDLSIVGLTVVYLLQLVDANVEAHFVAFDVSDNLSLRVTPTISPTFSTGIQLSLTFNQKKRSSEIATFVLNNGL